MRSRPTAIALALAAILLPIACASPVEVLRDPTADFSRYRTWDWLPGEALVIHAPETESGLAELRLVRGITEELARRGFQRARRRPDLRVGVVLAIRSGLRVTRQTGAVESVFSYHEGSNFEIQASRTAVERVDQLSLEVYVSENRGPIVWQARLREQVSGDSVGGLADALLALLADFPSQGVHVLRADRVPAPAAEL